MQYEYDEKTIAQMDYLSKISIKISEWEINHPDQELPHTMAWD